MSLDTGPLRRRTLLALRPGWPFVATFALFPVWWALGLGVLIFIIMRCRWCCI